jgi:hypothetical protein
MPRIGQPTRIQIEGAFAEFASGFRRSRRGNLWREYDAWIVTVFRCQDGGFAWRISACEDDVQFSEETYETEQEAMDSMGAELLRLNFG